LCDSNLRKSVVLLAAHRCGQSGHCSWPQPWHYVNGIGA